jgi:hypothetical protein
MNYYYNLNIFITLFLTLYSGFLGPELPPFIKNLFNNSIIKIIVLYLFIYSQNIIGNHTALIMVIAFILTLDYIYVDESKEKMNIIKSKTQ